MNRFTFTLPPPSMFGFNGRDILASALDGVPGVDPLFNYRGGMPIPDGGMPEIRMWSFGSKLVIEALTAAARDIVMQNFSAILDGLSGHFNVTPAVAMANAPIDVKYGEYPILYSAKKVVLARGLDACLKFQKATAEEKIRLAHNVLCRGLSRQAQALSIDLGEIADGVGAYEDRLPPAGILFDRITPRASLIRKGGETVEHGVVVDMRFMWRARITGSWAVGGLTSRGNGRIWYAAPNGGAQ